MPIRKRHAVLLLVVLASLAGFGQPAPRDPAASDKGSNTRLLTGKVLDRRDNPVPDSVVYLTNLRTRAIKTYIVSADGAYHFPELSPNIDYEVFAQYQGRKSETKTVSQFDDRKLVNIVLRMDTK